MPFDPRKIIGGLQSPRHAGVLTAKELRALADQAAAGVSRLGASGYGYTGQYGAGDAAAPPAGPQWPGMPPAPAAPAAAAAFVGCRLEAQAGSNPALISWQPPNLNPYTYDPDAFFSIGAPGVLAAPAAGRYAVSAGIYFNSTGALAAIPYLAGLYLNVSVPGNPSYPVLLGQAGFTPPASYIGAAFQVFVSGQAQPLLPAGSTFSFSFSGNMPGMGVLGGSAATSLSWLNVNYLG